MQATGFVLAGGRSERMGRDKALLPFGAATLVEYVAQTVRDVVGPVTLIGDPAKFGHLGLPVLPDELPGCGPASGIYTALRASATDWNLILACDMPGISADVLRSLVRAAEPAGRSCVAATGPDGQPEPLCAFYHRRCLPALSRAIRDKRLKMRDLIKEIGAIWVKVDASALANVNTPEEWLEFEGGVPKADS
jgi:molybdopterin-guanine dinucleotide biosynthesis protein A